jgi:hypothetical protein
VGVRALLFDQQAAMTALKSWAEFALDGFFGAAEIRRGQRNAPANGQRQVTIVPVSAGPSSYAWTPVIEERAQRNRVQLEITTAAPGLWRLAALGQDVTYNAAGGDTAAQIAAGLLAASVAFTGLSVSSAGPETLELLGATAGAWLGVALTVPAGGAAEGTVIDDTIRRFSWAPCKWTVAITIDDIRPASGASAVTNATAYLVEILLAGDVPIVNGSAVTMSADLLAAASLYYLSHETPQTLDYYEPKTGPAQGTVWRERSRVDVVFQTTKGIAFDLPSLEVVGPPTIIIEEA